MSLRNISLIGLGEIGSRHLQALAKYLDIYQLYCVDPSEESIKLAKSRLPRLSESEISRINFYNSIDSLPKNLDLVIIATSSDIRLAVFKELSKICSIENLIFEKVLFQKVSHLRDAKDILEQNNINAWVNCSRRNWPIYQEVKKLLQGKESINFKVTGCNWGLACNAIHYLDILGWISSSDLQSIEGKSLENKTLESKRKGFLEFNGTINASFTNRHKMSLTSSTKNQDLLVKIEAEDLEVLINESAGDFSINFEENSRSEKFSIPFQSELTGLIAAQILEGKDVLLPEYDYSSAQHYHLLETFIEHLEKIKKEKIEYCPIT